ncbi:MAG: N-acetylmuramoyl-L-alanine amidase, partial [Dehalococcoidia bacterium]|nr:N-acetylmuramoyl-L-alanine amidase [Dehalococcoidia bacterium]
STATPEADAPTPEPPLLTYAPAPEAEEHEAQAMPVSPFQPEAAAPPSAAEDACPDRELDPLPRSGVAGSQDFWRSFREPLPPAPVWNPPGPKRVGIQAGHWRTDDVPTELARLAGGGTSGGGYAEWEVNLDLAQRTAAILERYGVQVDILPATVPPSYRAHAFVSIHADGDLSGALHGFKVARSGFSPIPETDDVLVDKLYAEYENATGLSRDDIHVSLRMRYYYAFNSRRYCHAITPGVPAAIVEAGFLTNAADRQLLLGNPDAAAEGIARGVLSFLGLLEQQGR